jgi:hypothetical protein
VADCLSSVFYGKYVWAIEQNEARETYLGHYFGIDIADHMIKNAQIKFTSWRY